VRIKYIVCKNLTVKNITVAYVLHQYNNNGFSIKIEALDKAP